MFGTILTATFTILLIYVLWRAGAVPLLKRHVSRKGFISLGAILWVFFFLARTIGHDGTSPVGGIIEFVGMVLLGSIFLTATAVFVVDLGTVFGRALPRWAPSLYGWAITAGVVLSGIALFQGIRSPAVVSYDVTLAGLPACLNGTVLVAVSDTHLGTQLGSRWITQRVGQIEALRPDMVVFLGDIFEGHGGAPPDIPALRNLAAPLGKWFVNGNHESYGNTSAGVAVLTKAGFHGLDNQWVIPAPGLVLCGVNDLTNHNRRHLDEDPLALALANRPGGATVLLSHTPWQATRAAHAGVGLMLSGHTHGGQIWPFGYLVQRAYPLLAGRYDVDGMPVIVSRGAGTWGPRMRLWQPGEIMKISIHASAPTSAKRL